MDNPQHYQPLSHALHPPSASAARAHYTATGQHAGYAQQDMAEQSAQVQSQVLRRAEEEEEEEEEEEDEDEGLVEDQLNQTDIEMHPSTPSSPKGSNPNDPQSRNPHLAQQAAQGAHSSPPILEKRRPGRPRGSKNRKPRVSGKNESQFYANQTSSSSTGSTATLAALPAHPNITPQNQPYYEFQWRMLNLCAEFYGAAEELVKATSPLVVAQCYHLGPGVKVDPLAMVGEAKRVCDTLLANPSQLVTNPPPPVYPVLPTMSMYPHVMQPPIVGPSTSATLPTTVSPPTNNVVTSSTAFVVPLGQPGYAQYQIYGHPSQHAQYPTTPYYPPPYPPYQSPYYPPPHQHQTLTASASRTLTGAPAAVNNNNNNPQPAATIATSPATGGTMIGNTGPWTEEEMEKLKKLAEESKKNTRGGQAGETDWDWVVSEWGHSRTRHQVLIQASKLNLKESTTRGTKRRREEGQADVSGVTAAPTTFQQPPATPAPATAASTSAITTTGLSSTSPAPSLSHSAVTATPGASPALQSQQRPSSSSSAPGNSTTAATTTSTTTTITPSATKLPWPMPTVAAVSSPGVVLSTPASTATTATATTTTTPSIAAAATTQQQDQRSSYYRPRPTDANKAAAGQQHLQQQQQQQQQHYLYAQNGAFRQKENGK